MIRLSSRRPSFCPSCPTITPTITPTSSQSSSPQPRIRWINEDSGLTRHSVPSRNLTPITAISTSTSTSTSGTLSCSFHSSSSSSKSPSSTFSVSTIPSSHPNHDFSPSSIRNPISVGNKIARRKELQRIKNKSSNHDSQVVSIDPRLYQFRKLLDRDRLREATDIARESYMQKQERVEKDASNETSTSVSSHNSSSCSDLALSFQDYQIIFQQFHSIFSVLSRSSNSRGFNPELISQFHFWQESFLQFLLLDDRNLSPSDKDHPGNLRGQSLSLFLWAKVRLLFGQRLSREGSQRQHKGRNERQVAQVVARWLCDDLSSNDWNKDLSLSDLPLAEATNLTSASASARGSVRKLTRLNVETQARKTVADLVTLLIVSQVRIFALSHSDSDSDSNSNSHSASESLETLESRSKAPSGGISSPELRDLLSLVRLLPLGHAGMPLFHHSSRDLADDLLREESSHFRAEGQELEQDLGPQSEKEERIHTHPIPKLAEEWMAMVELSRGLDLGEGNQENSTRESQKEQEQEKEGIQEEDLVGETLLDGKGIDANSSSDSNPNPDLAYNSDSIPSTSRTNSNRLARLFGSLFSQNRIREVESLVKVMIPGFQFRKNEEGEVFASHSWLWFSSLPIPDFLSKRKSNHNDALKDDSSGFRSPPRPDWTPITSSIILSGLLRFDQIELTTQLWSTLCQVEKIQSHGQRDLPTDCRIWTGLITGYAEKGHYAAVDSTWELLMKNSRFRTFSSNDANKNENVSRGGDGSAAPQGRINVDGAAYTTMINSLFKSKRRQQAMDLFSEMRRLAMEKKIFDSTSSIYTHRIPVETFNTVIHGLSTCDRLPEAISLFKEMVQNENENQNQDQDQSLSNPKPNISTLNTLMRSSSRIGDIESLISILKTFEMLDLEPDVITYTTVLDCFLRVNSTFAQDQTPQTREEEEDFIREQNQRDEKSVENVLNIMEQQNVKPNHATFTAMINNLLNPTPMTPFNSTMNHHLKRGRMALSKRDVKNLKKSGSRINHPRILAAMNLLNKMEKSSSSSGGSGGSSMGNGNFNLKPNEITYGLFLQSLNSQGAKMTLMPFFHSNHLDLDSEHPGSIDGNGRNGRMIFELPKPYRFPPQPWSHLVERIESRETLNGLHCHFPHLSISFNILNQIRKSRILKENRKIYHFLLNNTLSRQDLSFVSNPQDIGEQDLEELKRIDRLIWNRACSLLDEMILSSTASDQLLQWRKTQQSDFSSNRNHNHNHNHFEPFFTSLDHDETDSESNRDEKGGEGHLEKLKRNLRALGLEAQDIPKPNHDTWHLVLKSLLSRLESPFPSRSPSSLTPTSRSAMEEDGSGTRVPDFQSTSRQEIREKLRLALSYAQKSNVDFKRINGHHTYLKALQVVNSGEEERIY